MTGIADAGNDHGLTAPIHSFAECFPIYIIDFRKKRSIPFRSGANIRRSREQCKCVKQEQTGLRMFGSTCIAEAQQYMWTRSGQI